MYNDLLYQIALTLVPHIGDVHAKILAQHFGSAKAIFQARKKDLEAIDGIGGIRAANIKAFSDFSSSEAELHFIEENKILPLFINSPQYPQRLLNCYDSPALLYYKGNADLNCSRIIAVVGTRSNSDYGKQFTESLVEQLAGQDILLISGLAFGIDSIAHKAALKNKIPTVGVLAHGLDRVYPIQNNSLAKQMTEQGGLLTDFVSQTNPDKQNFPRRNRIVAGLCDALLVVESCRKGGSLITAELANGYNKDVFAVPGRINDSRSEGCNYLVMQNKAAMITSAQDLLDAMRWGASIKPVVKKQRELFVELTADERKVADILLPIETMHVDELYIKSGLSSSTMAAALLMLEMKGLAAALPGKMYKFL